MSTLIPNTFQHPNAYIDWLSYYLTGEEEKVLNKAVREILGWHDTISSRRARIALSIFVDGKKKDGEIVCMGCGLSLDAVRKALKTLHQFNILVKIGKPTNDGQEYELVETWDDIKWDAIRLRRDQWDKANRKRTEAAREAREEGVLSDNGGYCGTVGQGVMSDSNKETQASLETQGRGAKRAPFSPLQDSSYTISIYYNDKSLVKAKERVKTGPWEIICQVCGNEVEITELDTPVECLCGMHEYILLSKKPMAKRKRKPEAVEAYYSIASSKGIKYDSQDDDLEERIASTVTDVPFWRQVVIEYIIRWSPKNILTMLEYYERRQLPGTKQGEEGGGETTHTPPPPEPDLNIPEYTEEELREWTAHLADAPMPGKRRGL